MEKRRAVRSFVCVLTALLLIPAAGEAPVAARAAGSCPAVRPEFSIGFVEAFAHPIDDNYLLELVSNVTHQEGVLTKPFHLVPGAGPVNLPPPSVRDPGCRMSQVPYAVARTTQMAMMKWKLKPDQLDALIPRLESAFEALARRNELERGTIDAALRPFGLTFREFQETPDPRDVCSSDGEAHNTDVNVGFLTFDDHVSRVAHLRVQVDLTDEALVRDIRILSNSTAGTPYEDTFADFTLDAGAAAPYETVCTNGRQHAASFIYSADYK